MEWGKRLGLDKVYRGGDGSAVQLTPEIHAWLAGIFAADITYLEERLQRDFSSWRSFRARASVGTVPAVHAP